MCHGAHPVGKPACSTSATGPGVENNGTGYRRASKLSHPTLACMRGAYVHVYTCVYTHPHIHTKKQIKTHAVAQTNKFGLRRSHRRGGGYLPIGIYPTEKSRFDALFVFINFIGGPKAAPRSSLLVTPTARSEHIFRGRAYTHASALLVLMANTRNTKIHPRSSLLVSPTSIAQSAHIFPSPYTRASAMLVLMANTQNTKQHTPHGLPASSPCGEPRRGPERCRFVRR